MNGGKADLTDYGKSLPSLQEIQLQLHALTSNPVNIVVNEDVTVRAKSKNLTPIKVIGPFGLTLYPRRIDGKSFLMYRNYPYSKSDWEGAAEGLYVAEHELSGIILDSSGGPSNPSSNTLIIEKLNPKYSKIVFTDDKGLNSLKAECLFFETTTINNQTIYRYKGIPDVDLIRLLIASSSSNYMVGVQMFLFE